MNRIKSNKKESKVLELYPYSKQDYLRDSKFVAKVLEELRK